MVRGLLWKRIHRRGLAADEQTLAGVHPHIFTGLGFLQAELSCDDLYDLRGLIGRFTGVGILVARPGVFAFEEGGWRDGWRRRWST